MVEEWITEENEKKKRRRRERKKEDDDVSAKAALGKEEPAKKDADVASAVMPTADDMAEADIGQIINMLNMLRSGKSTKDEEVKNQVNQFLGA